LAVGDGVVTVEDLVDEKLYLDPPLLAYLSACSTGSIQVDSLVEESIHLAGTFLAAGFQNVIASLWKVSDSCSAEVAELVYTNIVNGGIGSGSVARGLHFALKSLRDRDVATSVFDVEYGKIKARQFGPDISGLGSGTPRFALHSIYPWASYMHMGY
jgi:CHAT domain-containing protein